MTLDTSRHPCFSREARHQYARVHLPVAPRCNVQCNFCDRRYDCMNESRPGVTSAVLTPEQSLAYLRKVKGLVERLSVVGIAGPGDPFANPKETMETLRLIREDDPEMLLCVASNGLQVGPYVEELARLKVSHVTLTVNAVDPEIGARVYAWMRDGTRVVRGRPAAQLLLERQLEAIRRLHALGVTVKVNSIIIPGVNEHHLGEVARVTAAAGADLFNAMPLCPVAGTPFAANGAPTMSCVAEARRQAGAHLPLMTHCTRCRADAVGRLGEATTVALSAALRDCAAGRCGPGAERPHVAVASAEGMLVNQHLGEADRFLVFNREEGGAFREIGARMAPEPGGGPARWGELADRLQDCRAVLVSGAGPAPQEVLERAGVRVVLAEGLVSEALEAVYAGKPVSPPRRAFRCGEACQGQGTGCG